MGTLRPPLVLMSMREVSEGSHLRESPGDVQVNVTVAIGHGLSSLTEKEAGKVANTG